MASCPGASALLPGVIQAPELASQNHCFGNLALGALHHETKAEMHEEHCWSGHLSESPYRALQRSIGIAHSPLEQTLIRTENVVLRSRILKNPVLGFLNTSRPWTSCQSQTSHMNRSRTFVDHPKLAENAHSVPTFQVGQYSFHSQTIRTRIHSYADQTSTAVTNDGTPLQCDALASDGCVCGNCGGNSDRPNKAESCMYMPPVRHRQR